jgi:hypothetical protein
MEQYGYQGGGPFFHHQYLIPPEAKVMELQKVMKQWGAK